ncbi:hypothetical protein MJI37_32265, partial [Salmonella enterica subsp. enterica serovar Cerro]|nr:hypothetical protein [Salmonella enterica subsp. enterica serovar Cerro]
NRSYFLHDLLTQFIFREAHLVEPNLQWAWRYRLLRLGGHLLVHESAITGESAPVIRESGGDFASVTGGTRILSDWLVIACSVNPG